MFVRKFRKIEQNIVNLHHYTLPLPIKRRLQLLGMNKKMFVNSPSEQSNRFDYNSP